MSNDKGAGQRSVPGPYGHVWAIQRPFLSVPVMLGPINSDDAKLLPATGSQSTVIACHLRALTPGTRFILIRPNPRQTRRYPNLHNLHPYQATLACCGWNKSLSGMGPIH